MLHTAHCTLLLKCVVSIDAPASKRCSDALLHQDPPVCPAVGMATANGAVALLDNMPSMDATEVMQVKNYGALVLAKGNMAEWAFSNAISIGSGKLAHAVFLPWTSCGASSCATGSMSLYAVSSRVKCSHYPQHALHWGRQVLLLTSERWLLPP